MNAFNEWVVAALAQNGLPLLLLVSFAGSLGIPFPITLVIIAAGAFSRQGLFDWRLAGPVCLLGAMLADQAEYLLGRRAQPWLLRRFGQKAAWRQAEGLMERQGAWAVLLTRFWLTSLAPAVNVLAGGRTPYPRFLLYDLLGETVWVLAYGGLGYFFAAEWQRVSRAASWFSVLSFLLAAGAAFAWWRRRQEKRGRKEVNTTP